MWENQDVSGKVTLKIKHRRGKEQMMETSLLAAGILSMGIHQQYLPPKESFCPPAVVPVMLGLVFLSHRQGLIPLCTNRNLTSFNHVPKTRELQTIDFSVRVIDDLHGRPQHSKQPNFEFGLAQMASDLILFDTTDYKEFFSGVNPHRRSCMWTCSKPHNFNLSHISLLYTRFISAEPKVR